MSFRSLLEAAMGDAQELSQDEVGRIDAQVDMLDDEYQPSDGLEESDDAGVVEEEEEDSDIERQLWASLASVDDVEADKRSVTATKVPPELANVLGEANMLYASHQYDEAITLLKDFIKKAPTIPDPYHTLGMIYEDRQDRIKALQFFLIATQSSGNGSAYAKDEKNFDQALFCFKKASSADPKDKEALFSYADEVFKKLTVLIPNDLSLWIQIAEAYHCNEQEDEAVDALKKCIEKAATLDPARNLHSSKYELNAVNMLADLYITLKRYREAIDVIHHLHSRYASTQGPDQVEGDPGGLPLDIAVKYGICHLFERDFATAESMFTHLFAQDVEVFGDLYLDVADAYIALEDQDREAAAILQQLLGREEFPVEQIWIKFAACHDRLGIYDVAVEYYEKALAHQRSSPDLTVDPELMLQAMRATRKKSRPLEGIALLKEYLPESMRPPIRPYWINTSRKNKDQDSLSAQGDGDSDADELEEEADDEEDTEDQTRMEMAHDPSLSVDAMENGIRLKLLIEYGHLKKLSGEAEVLCQVGIPIILTSLSQTSFRLSGRVKNPLAEPQDVISESDAQSMGFQVLKSEYLVDITDSRQRESFMGIVMRVAQQIVISRALGEQQYYNLVIDVAQTLTELGKYVAAIELLTDVNTSDKISKPTLRFELRFLALVIALEFKENRMAYECARLNIMEDPHNLGYWNLFSRVIAITGVFSWHQKFLAKLLRDDPESYPAILLAGHQSSAWDIASLTVGELTLAHQKHPNDPLTLFCIGLAFLSASMQRTINDRQHTVAKAFAFLQQYERTRITAPSDITSDIRQVEAWYNIGRAHQQLGLFHLAIPMYERVLRFFEESNEQKREVPPEYLLCRETAYNLSLIYKQSKHGDGEDLWQQMLRDCSVRSKLPVANLLVVGDAESGKSALLARLDEAKSTPSETADETHAVDTLLAFKTLDVLDPRAKESGGDASEDVMAHIGTWSLNDLNLKDLIKIAVKPQTLQKTVVAIVLDLSRPWTIKGSLEQWLSALEGQLLEQINQLAPETRNELYGAIKQHILAYEDPSVDHSAPTPMDTSTNEFMEEGVLSKNLGVPLVIVVAKADLRPENSVKMDYIEYTLRQFAIRYGASVVFTSAKTGSNVDTLRKYILHRAYPSQFKFTVPPQLVDHNGIFIPSGYDSFELVNQSLVGSQARWPTDKPFEKIVPAPTEDTDDAATMLATDIRVDSHEQWLEKLEKAAGAGLEELQKQSIEASKKAEQAAVARRAASDRRKREEKDVSSKHLQNFFNNLLSRPEKPNLRDQ
ncbi:P-loop containing nucleoside triphosphate hydrolase [Phytophthora cactorum]|nr:P-loop containing nucleoside triphosphate hydrolase [Phytophthora cactorum]